MYSKIVVIGSLNMDMVMNVKESPVSGETILGQGFFMSAGGKGANQAYAVGKLGGSVSMIGQVGNDLFADQLISNLSSVGVNTSLIKRTPSVSSGVAMITVNQRGENSICVAPGANYHITPEYIELHRDTIINASILMIQLEIPMDAVNAAIKIAHSNGVKVILDPAPAQPIPKDITKKVDYILPNESEIEQLTRHKVHSEHTAKIASRLLLELGVTTVVSKLGEKGVMVTDKDGSFYVSGHVVNVVDTTAAGDAFAGAFANALVEGMELKAAIEYANAVGAVTVTKSGAQPSIPTAKEVERFLMS